MIIKNTLHPKCIFLSFQINNFKKLLLPFGDNWLILQSLIYYQNFLTYD